MRIFQELLKIHFEKFEKNLNDENDASAVSMEFPRLIIDAFNKILRLWIQHPKMQSTMNPDELQPIYGSLSNELFSSFGEVDDNGAFGSNAPATNGTNFSYMCGICDEEIQIQNNDLDHSFDVHARTHGYWEIEEKLDGTEKEAETNNATSSGSASPAKTLSAELLFSNCAESNVVGEDNITQKVQTKRTKESVIQVAKKINKNGNQSDASDCAECTDVDSVNEKLLLSSLPDTISSVFTKFNNADKFLCSTCDCWVPPTRGNLTEHVDGKQHITKEKQKNTTKILTSASAPSEVLKCFAKSDSFAKSRWCRVCRCLVPTGEDEKNLTIHVRGIRHELKLKCKNLFALNDAFVEVFDTANYSFLCKACLVQKTGLSTFINHCRSVNHQLNTTQFKKDLTSD